MSNESTTISNRSALINRSISVVSLLRSFGSELIPISAPSDSGPSYKCRCILKDHNGYDNTPSMMVYESTNTWWSFCCSKGSTAIDLTMELMQKTFIESVEYLEATYKDDMVLSISERPKTNTSAVMNYLYGLASNYRQYLNSMNGTDSYDKEAKDFYLYWKNLDNTHEDLYSMNEVDAKFLYDSLRARLIKKGFTRWL